MLLISGEKVIAQQFHFPRALGHTGWMGREWGATTSSLNFDGYPAEAPYVPSDNPFQYPGYDANNVLGYTCCRIQLGAYIYGGHSGGPEWRFDGTNRYVEGVNSTSNRAGYAQAYAACAYCLCYIPYTTSEPSVIIGRQLSTIRLSVVTLLC